MPLPWTALALLSLNASSSPALAQDAEPVAAEAPVVEPQPAPTVTYTLDGAKGTVFVMVLKDESTVLSGLSHNHVIQAKGWSGTATWNVDDPGACAVELTVPVDQLDVDPQWLRDRVGYTQKLKDSDRETIRKNMLAADQLDAARHSTIRFVATRCQGAAGAYKVTGDLTLRGRTAPVTALMKVEADGQAFSASGRLETTHTAFGFQPYAAPFGALKNRDELQFVIQVEGRAQ